MKGWNDSRRVSQMSWYFCLLAVGSLLLLEYFLWVLGSVGGAVKVGNPDIYDCIGSAFKDAANGNVTAFLSVVG
jgi:hypothetical protein